MLAQIYRECPALTATCTNFALTLANASFGGSSLGELPSASEAGRWAPRHATQLTQASSTFMSSSARLHTAKARRLNADDGSGGSSLGDVPIDGTATSAPRPCEELRRIELQDERHRDQRDHADFLTAQRNLHEPVSPVYHRNLAGWTRIPTSFFQPLT